MNTLVLSLVILLIVGRFFRDPAAVVLRRVRAWLEETHSSRFELHRHFLFRLFESELISAPEQGRVIAGGALGILISLGLLFTQTYYHKYVELLKIGNWERYQQAFVADELFVISLVMLAVALFTTMEWPSIFPSLRDYLALAGLPVRMRDVFVSKFNSLFGAVLIVTIAAAWLPSLLLPAVASAPLIYVPAIFLPSVAAGLLVFLSLVTLQGVLLNVLPVGLFARVSLAIQGLLLALLLCSLPLVFSIPNLANWLDSPPAWFAWMPPAWFLAMNQRISGTLGGWTAPLEVRGLWALAVTALAAFATYLWSYRRHRRRVLESPGLEHPAAHGLVDSLAARFISCPRRLAVFAFTGKTLARSRQHRLVLTAFVAVALAVIFESFVSLVLNPTLTGRNTARVQAAIAVPLALSLFVLAGLRYLFRLPMEIRANWVFRIHEPGHALELLRGVDVFLWFWAVLPVSLAALPVEMALLGPASGTLVTGCCALISLVAAEVILFTYERIPFTSTYFPGKKPLVETLLKYSVVAMLYIGAGSSVLRLLARRATNLAILVAVLAALWYWLHRARLQNQSFGRLEFEEGEDGALQLLGIEKD